MSGDNNDVEIMHRFWPDSGTITPEHEVSVDHALDQQADRATRVHMVAVGVWMVALVMLAFGMLAGYELRLHWGGPVAVAAGVALVVTTPVSMLLLRRRRACRARAGYRVWGDLVGMARAAHIAHTKLEQGFALAAVPWHRRPGFAQFRHNLRQMWQHFLMYLEQVDRAAQNGNARKEARARAEAITRAGRLADIVLTVSPQRDDSVSN